MIAKNPIQFQEELRTSIPKRTNKIALCQCGHTPKDEAYQLDMLARAEIIAKKYGMNAAIAYRTFLFRKEDPNLIDRNIQRDEIEITYRSSLPVDASTTEKPDQIIWIRYVYTNDRLTMVISAASGLTQLFIGDEDKLDGIFVFPNGFHSDLKHGERMFIASNGTTDEVERLSRYKHILTDPTEEGNKWYWLLFDDDGGGSYGGNSELIMTFQSDEFVV